jgi:fructokinase
MNKPLIIAVGEILWDLLPAGRQPGGASANFAYHAQALGAEALLVTRLGDDSLGAELLAHLKKVGLNTEGVEVDLSAPTGTVSVSLDSGGKPNFIIHEHVAWDCIEPGAGVLERVARADAVCFGTLAQRCARSRMSVQAILRAAPRGALRVFDINLRQHFWSQDMILESLELADVLKLNDDELPVVAGVLGLVGDESEQVWELARRFDLKAVALTRGADGSSLWIGGRMLSRAAGRVRVADTVGAGDSYTAALVLGLLAGKAPERILEEAHRIAEYVCARPGAMPPMEGFVRGN